MKTAKLLVAALALVLCVGPTQAAETHTDFQATPNLGIPDDTEGPGYGVLVSTTVESNIGSLVTGISVQMNLTHAYPSDLRVGLISPAGTDIRIYNLGAWGGETNITGWRPGDWDSDGDLTDGFDGEFTEGTWTLWMQDYSYGQAGTLNNWTLRIFYDDTVSNEESTWSKVKAIFR